MCHRVARPHVTKDAPLTGLGPTRSPRNRPVIPWLTRQPPRGRGLLGPRPWPRRRPPASAYPGRPATQHRQPPTVADRARYERASTSTTSSTGARRNHHPPAQGHVRPPSANRTHPRSGPGQADHASQQPDLSAFAYIVRTAHSDSNQRPRSLLAFQRLPATLTPGTDIHYPTYVLALPSVIDAAFARLHAVGVQQHGLGGQHQVVRDPLEGTRRLI